MIYIVFLEAVQLIKYCIQVVSILEEAIAVVLVKVMPVATGKVIECF